MYAMKRSSVLEVEARGGSTARRLFSIIVCVLSLLSTTANSSARIYTYVYEGRPFGIDGANLLPGATHIFVMFSVSTLLSDNTNYDVTSPPFRDLVMSDGVNTTSVAGGTINDASFVRTTATGYIGTWFIAELIWVGRTFSAGACCTIGDPPVLYTSCCNFPSDASIQTNGFFGIGPRTDFAYNNLAAGAWTVPEPSTWTMLLLGFGGLGFLGHRQTRSKTSGGMNA
jgi:hypothetical protein